MISRRCIVAVAFAAGTAWVTQPAKGQESQAYAVQLAAFPGEAEAAQLRDQLQSTTCPVFLRNDASSQAPFKVCVGPFATYTDAWAVKTALPEGYPKGFIASLGTTSTEALAFAAEQSSATASVPGVFVFRDLPGDVPMTVSNDPSEFVSIAVPEEQLPLTEEVLEKPEESMSRSELLVVGVKASDNAKGRGALGHFLEEYPQDTANKAAHLRLARRHLSEKNYSQAAEQLNVLESSGTAQEKRKARMVRAYLTASEKGSAQGFKVFKELADDEALAPPMRSHAMRMAAGHAHASREYTTAVLAYNQIIHQSPVVQERLEARLQRCAAMFELVSRGKGKWPEVISECAALKAEADAPQVVQAGAGLMEFEAHRFADDFETSYLLGKAFLQQWGEDPSVYEGTKMRQYINTARLFQMQNAYVTGHGSEALALASNVLANPPAENEQYSRGNTFLYACVIGHLSALEADNAQQASDFKSQGRGFNDAYFTMLTQAIQDMKAKHLAQ